MYCFQREHVFFGTLLQITERKDWEESNQRFSAYEAINMFIKNSAKDCQPVLV